MTSKFTIALSALLAWSAVSLSQSTIQLTNEWEKAVFPFSAHTNFAACVDNKQNVHVVASDGAWATLSASGVMLRESQEDTLKGALSVVCSDADTVVVGVPRAGRMYVFSGDHRYLRDVRADTGSGKILGVAGGSAIVLSGTKSSMFKRVDITGATEERPSVEFGQVPPSLASSTSPARAGKGVLDGRRNLIIYVRNNPEQVSVYDREGQLVSSRLIEGGVRPKGMQEFGTAVRNDDASGIFPIGTGYIVNIWQEEFTPGKESLTSHLRYQILDEQFNVVGYAAAEGIGTIVATDGRETVFGLGGGPKITLVKAHIGPM